MRKSCNKVQHIHSVRKTNHSSDLSLSLSAFYVHEHPYGYRENAQLPRFRGRSHCPHCFCAPCIIAMPPDYLRGSASPHDANDEKRHVLYRKFWRTLKALGLWQDEEYLSRKALRTARDDKRDIIPDCVIKVTYILQSYTVHHRSNSTHLFLKPRKSDNAIPA